MAIREGDSPVSNVTPVHAVPSSGSPALKQPAFELKAKDKYEELCNFEIEVKNIFLTNSYNTQESETVPIILNWLC